jgi:hypothetical protein
MDCSFSEISSIFVIEPNRKYIIVTVNINVCMVMHEILKVLSQHLPAGTEEDAQKSQSSQHWESVHGYST